MSTKARWRAMLAAMPCVVGARCGGCVGHVELHHVAAGSAKRHDYALVPLCHGHHDPERAGSGFHGMGTERFCKIFRVPGEVESGLLVWLLEDLARARFIARAA